jgi:hypothetical protein
MPEHSSVERFLAAYRAGFEALDAEAIADLFAYPCQITADGDEIEVTTVGSRQAWVSQLERLVDAYRKIGVRTANVLKLDSVDLTSRLAQATVTWHLADADGQSVYAFRASYTLADLGDGLRITAIAHDEKLRLLAALTRQAARQSRGRPDD